MSLRDHSFILGIIGSVFAAMSLNSAWSQQPSEQSYWVEEIVTGLDLPRSIAWLPNGDALIGEWTGRILVLHAGEIAGTIAGTPKVFEGHYDGLRDIKLDPDFVDNQIIYLTFTDGDEKERSGRVFRARLDGHRLVQGRVIFTVVPAMPPFGPIIGRILFLPDKTMLVGVGSGDQSHAALVQRRDNHIGKIIRIRRDGSVPPDNPFVTTPGVLPEIWALGLRNPSGLTRASNGDILAVDIGPKGGDEFNKLKPGANYGWPLASWGFDYSGRSMSGTQDGHGFSDPILIWSPSFTPSDLVQYSGDKYQYWNGDFFVTGLSGQSVRRIRVRNDEVILQEKLLADLHERFRSIQVGPDNYLYLLTDAYGQGRLLRLRPDVAPPAARIAKSIWSSSTAELDRGWNEKMTERQKKMLYELDTGAYNVSEAQTYFATFCAQCHIFGRFRTGNSGPPLDGINGRRAGRFPGYDYSASFTDIDRQIVWDYFSLVAYLQQPQILFPNTKMSIPSLPRKAVVEIAHLLSDGEYVPPEVPGKSTVEKQD